MQSQIIEKPASGPDAPGSSDLIAVRKFRAELGTHPSTVWRWFKRGWLEEPINIGGRLYLTRGQIAEFKRRAAAGEFSKNMRPPAPAKKGVAA